jgi:hypothetical protein
MLPRAPSAPTTYYITPGPLFYTATPQPNLGAPLMDLALRMSMFNQCMTARGYSKQPVQRVAVAPPAQTAAPTHAAIVPTCPGNSVWTGTGCRTEPHTTAPVSTGGGDSPQVATGPAVAPPAAFPSSVAATAQGPLAPEARPPIVTAAVPQAVGPERPRQETATIVGTWRGSHSGPGLHSDASVLEIARDGDAYAWRMWREVRIVGLPGVLVASGTVKDLSSSRFYLFGQYESDTFGRSFTGQSVYYSLKWTPEVIEGYLRAADGRQYSVSMRRTRR